MKFADIETDDINTRLVSHFRIYTFCFFFPFIFYMHTSLRRLAFTRVNNKPMFSF